MYQVWQCNVLVDYVHNHLVTFYLGAFDAESLSIDSQTEKKLKACQIDRTQQHSLRRAREFCPNFFCSTPQRYNA
jgi:1,4-alpha-glucan branching enzyme